MIKLPSSSSPSSSSHPSGGSSSGGAPKYEIHLCITFLFISPFISLHLESIIWSPSSSPLPPSSSPLPISSLSSQSSRLSSLQYFSFHLPIHITASWEHHLITIIITFTTIIITITINNIIFSALLCFLLSIHIATASWEHHHHLKYQYDVLMMMVSWWW